MENELLNQVAFAAHRFVEGGVSYDDLVKAVKAYADDCDVPLSPKRREVFSPASDRTEGSPPASGRTKGKELESALESWITTLRKALAKHDNEKRIGELYTTLKVLYWNAERKRKRNEKETSKKSTSRRKALGRKEK